MWLNSKQSKYIIKILPGLPEVAKELQVTLLYFICYLVETVKYMNTRVQDKELRVLLQRETDPSQGTRNEITALPGIPCLSSLEEGMK
jgi:hypothetical protein